MKYKVRSGVVRTKICGVSLLIPDRHAAEYCSRIQKLSLFGDAVMEVIEKGEPIDIVYTAYSILTKKTEAEAKTKIDTIVGDLSSKGYLIPICDDGIEEEETNN